MKYYEITKSYRGGAEKYYILLNDQEEVSEDMLESIGSNTDGGKNHGYSMDAKEIPSLPDGARLLPREKRILLY